MHYKSGLVATKSLMIKVGGEFRPTLYNPVTNAYDLTMGTAYERKKV